MTLHLTRLPSGVYIFSHSYGEDSCTSQINPYCYAHADYHTPHQPSYICMVSGDFYVCNDSCLYISPKEEMQLQNALMGENEGGVIGG